ncbi:peptidase M22, glycoprotease [Suhomyces tanzawaensis NRRL Y-17324]|uniref:N(6)-L-threonylcarbamoyladenine synthase n=1 Tax=Suhomyces tanzawaensis NRRL Y-17324 TaxID=984487 RepID=A0A1E4SE11_9ASCO|nr:peptidase M22, glycoprotease [Suhomyces tanzawaensis NRRL Y-17324]ODV77745.1 peptidase M22, glycoprotease [Suhomyces tanzawaensis NRRL Y-17324]
MRVFRRNYKVLALESSCDDACVALLEKESPHKPPLVIDQFKKTLLSAENGGIVPTAAHDFHHATMAPLVDEFCQKHSLNFATPPDLICCTRGPGMTGSLSSSIQLAKGLSMAWQVPVVGVHHMLGHILVSQLPKTSQPLLEPPQYPFLSLLCSGGHTMLVLLKSIVDHEIIIDVNDIAAGDSLDKCARELGLYGNMLGKELEKYVDSIPLDTRKEYHEINTKVKTNPYNLKLGLPFKGPRDPKYPDPIHFSFASFKSSIQSYRKQHHGDQPFDESTNQFLAYKIQETIFDHIIDRINTAFTMHGSNTAIYPEADSKFVGVRDLICSGGVAANSRLRHKLSQELKFNECLETEDKLTFHFPDLLLCTDNAVMIGVAGIELFEKLRIKTDLSMLAIRRWPLNEIMKVDGWTEINEAEFKSITRYR